MIFYSSVSLVEIEGVHSYIQQIFFFFEYQLYVRHCVGLAWRGTRETWLGQGWDDNGSENPIGRGTRNQRWLWEYGFRVYRKILTMACESSPHLVTYFPSFSPALMATAASWLYPKASKTFVFAVSPIGWNSFLQIAPSATRPAPLVCFSLFSSSWHQSPPDRLLCFFFFCLLLLECKLYENRHVVSFVPCHIPMPRGVSGM